MFMYSHAFMHKYTNPRIETSICDLKANPYRFETSKPSSLAL